MTPEKELEAIHKILGNRSDKKLWPSKMSAPAAIQRLINNQNADAAELTAKIDAEWQGKIETLETEIAQLRAMLVSWTTKCQDAEFQVDEMNREIASLNKAIDKAEVLTGELEAKLSETKSLFALESDRCARLEKQLLEAQAESVYAVMDRLRDSARSWKGKLENKMGLR